MGMLEYDIDPDLLHEFLDDSLDTLAPLESLFLELETSPENKDIINQIFRPIHSLKGNSAFFGMMRTKELSHKLENLLDLIRNDHKQVTAGTVQILLQGLDRLRLIISRVREDKNEVEDESSYNDLLDEITKETHEQGFDIFQLIDMVQEKLEDLAPHLPEEQQKELMEFQIRLLKHKADETVPVSRLRQVPPQLTELVDILSESFEGFIDEEKGKRVDALLKELPELTDSNKTRESISQVLDEYDTFVRQIGFDPLLREILHEKVEALVKEGKWLVASPASDEEEQAPEEKQGQNRSASKQSAGKTEESDSTMRVSEKRIDDFLAYVGELVVVEEMFNFLYRQLVVANQNRQFAQNFKRILETFDALADNLRQSILSIRMVPISSILQKTPRIIRDIASATGKKVEINIIGDKINIDKSYLELLDAPLTHMVRNAIDHGVETPEIRLESGKSETGSITIEVHEDENEISVSLIDDGQGINFEKVKKKAIELNLLQPNESLDQDKLIDFLFEAGMSTADKVTDISGRGVGMDVVKRNIDSVGGKIRIDTTPKMGTTFTITLPKNVTTQIMQGFLVQVASEIYVLPMTEICESFSPAVVDISTIAGKGEVVSRHGKLCPIIRLDSLLNNQKNQTASNILVTIEVKEKRFALCVDKIIGVQKVVVKPVADLVTNSQHLFDGAALMGDGTVAMVLNTEGLAKTMSQS